MSEPEQPLQPAEENDAEKAPREFNLALVYGVMLVALLIAIGLATLIVLPFYHRR